MDGPPIVFQLLHQPVLDDRPTPSKDEFDTTPGFDGPAVKQMWLHYLAGEPVPADAVPARAAELSGGASALITCSELDPLRDEAVDYALRLMWAGVRRNARVSGHVSRIRFARAGLGDESTAVRRARGGVEAGAARPKERRSPIRASEGGGGGGVVGRGIIGLRRVGGGVVGGGGGYILSREGAVGGQSFLVG